MLYTKQGVKLKGMSIEIMEAIPKIMHAYNYLGFVDVTITSANDSKHMDESLHYYGKAIDLRVWGMDSVKRREAVLLIRYTLGEEYDVIDEEDHIHVEFDSK